MAQMRRRRRRTRDERKEKGEEAETGGGQERKHGPARGREMMKQTAVVVSLSGSLETRALLRQPSEDKKTNQRTPPPPLLSLLKATPFLFLHLSVRFSSTAPLDLRLKAEAQTGVVTLAHPCSSAIALR